MRLRLLNTENLTTSVRTLEAVGVSAPLQHAQSTFQHGDTGATHQVQPVQPSEPDLIEAISNMAESRSLGKQI